MICKLFRKKTVYKIVMSVLVKIINVKQKLYRPAQLKMIQPKRAKKSLLLVGGGADLFHVGVALQYFDDSILLKCTHSSLHCRLAY